jgi:hypothetical protein
MQLVLRQVNDCLCLVHTLFIFFFTFQASEALAPHMFGYSLCYQLAYVLILFVHLAIQLE